MKVATVDIGTNSMRLLIADYDKNIISNREKYVQITKMGKDVDANKRISAESISRNTNALENFVNMAKEQNCEKIKVIGTSALRDSVNREEFINEAMKKTGIEVEIISGEMEANLGFLGVKNLLDKKDYTLTIDIGGGSTEFILANNLGELIFSKSEDIGSVRMTEKFLKTDPPTEFEILNLHDYIDMTINKTIDILKTYKIGKFIGIGGTATSISSMLQELSPYSSERVHNSKIYYDDLLRVFCDLSKKTLREKQMITGLQPQRADVIFAGVCILKEIMCRLNASYLVVSEYDNLEGLVYTM
ncbi:Ppx/GppA phosphatase family protein [Peptoanaerobacter stomatis]|uniref:Ppx/GppA phosphatase family protein n=1 Tax=Peptoanaerobacter stomatis TaxID=796937 RepID=J6H9L8_9FIRM|nr:Ppx/GppA phosphatase family protein [Peptoanaerobacter stomatis]EJU19583.1 Ppx/GppA phosphatase family protein [Peptoanaerobacter stomatis]NWO25321.1 Ppx/GppA family phosphatase [Peptostreptococcaceae bacterium oral taxon 081]